jgi:hypothetical protein
MSTDTDEQTPEGHPLTIERAKELINGKLGETYRGILSQSCAPIFWYQRQRSNAEILNSGTVTFVRTPKRLMAITAAHVIRSYEETHAAATWPLHLQVMNAWLNLEVIDISDDLDLATLAIDDKLLSRIGKDVEPLSTWPPRVPQEGRGILLAGYPGADRLQPKPMEVEWRLFPALGVAWRVLRDQITWVAERDPDIKTDLPPEHWLGGISGGPLIGIFESASHLAHHVLRHHLSSAPGAGESHRAASRFRLRGRLYHQAAARALSEQRDRPHLTSPPTASRAWRIGD